MEISILGTTYTIEEASEKYDPGLVGLDGYCDPSIRKCVVESFDDADTRTMNDMGRHKNKVIRHELIHAFLAESGLRECSDWADNEEMVDWFAMQFPKLAEAFKKCGFFHGRLL